MMQLFRCKNCGARKPANPRLKGNQNYCRESKCQRARKADWQRNKLAKDAEYRDQQKENLEQWRKKKPADQYQRHYREQHPEYVRRNREQQRIRNRKHRTTVSEKKIVKMDAFGNPIEKSTTYIMKPYSMDRHGKIVKMDTLIVQLQPFQEPSSRFFRQTL
jgi:hypothetical protein